MMAELALTFIPYVLSLIIGLKMCRILHGRLNPILGLGLSIGYGLSLTSILLFIQVVFMGSFSRTYALGLIIFTLAVLLNVHESKSMQKKTEVKPGFFTQSLLIISLAAAVVLHLAVFLKSPYGGGLDVWAIWKFKARILFLSERPFELLFNPQFKFSHFDYPVFYSLNLLWGWSLTGTQSVYSGLWISLMYWLGLLCTATGFILEIRPKASWVMPLILASTPLLTGYAASLYADTVVGMYFLSGVVMLVMSIRSQGRGLVLGAGWMFASSALIKNEGQMACAAAVVVILLSWRLIPRILYFVLGTALPAGALIYFRNMCPFENHMLSKDRLMSVVERGDLLPYMMMITEAIREQVMNENAWVYGWFFILLTTLFLGFKFLKQKRWIPHLFGSLMLAAYVMTFRDLEGHLKTSLDSVLLQIYPVFLIACYFAIISPSDTSKVLTSVSRQKPDRKDDYV